MIPLHLNLSASGWTLLAITVAVGFSFVLRVLGRDLRSDNTHAHAVALAILLVWMLYLVTP